MQLIEIHHEKSDWPTIIFNRPQKANALNDAMVDELLQALKWVVGQENRGLIIRAHGQHFSAGADLNEMHHLGQASFEENLKHAQRLAKLFAALHAFPKCLIVAAQGRIMGGAIAFLASADLAIVDPDSLIAFSEVRIGLIPALIAPYVVRKIGIAKAQRYFITGENIDATTAQTMGLIHEISSDFNQTIAKFKNTVNQNGPNAVIALKEHLQQISPILIDDDQNSNLLASIRASTEAQLGLRAFLNREKAPWQ